MSFNSDYFGVVDHESGLRPVNDRLRVLIGRIDAWEEDDDCGSDITPDGYRAAEELLLDIKQCLENCVRDY